MTPSPLHPNNKQGQANECSSRPEEIGGGGGRADADGATLMKTASVKQSGAKQGLVG